jgi:uncharacterized membrane protein YbhN (UPF0104 family)
MRLAINLILSLGMLALCTWLVWPDAIEAEQLRHVVGTLRWADFAPPLAGYFGLLLIVHLCRSLRWNHLLAPLGVKVPAGPLLAISSVGFMAILALPARLGEFVRPGLLRKGGYTTTAAALGTVAVERIVDGLIISLLVFGAFFAHRGPGAPGWMMPTAYLALGVFGAALVFLVFAMWRPEPTVTFCMRLTLLPRFVPRLARAIEHKLLDMIRGFAVLKDVRNLALFMVWSLVYWGANGLGLWLLAHAFHLELSLVGAFATMGLLGVGISLPNSPGLVGQFQAFTLLGLSVYLGFDASHPMAEALAFAIAQHLLQVAWYVAMGAIGLATPWVSFHDLWAARKVATGDDAPLVAELPTATAVALTGAAHGSNGTAVKKLAPEPHSAEDSTRASDRSSPLP